MEERETQSVNPYRSEDALLKFQDHCKIKGKSFNVVKQLDAAVVRHTDQKLLSTETKGMQTTGPESGRAAQFIPNNLT